MDQRKIKKLKEYFDKQKDVLMVFVFGSFAKGREMKESDFDIGVYFKSKQENFEKEDRIWSDLSKIIDDKEVHVVCLNEAPAILISDIFKSGTPLVIKDKKLYWELYLEKSTEAEDFVKFAEDYYKIAGEAKSLAIEQKAKLLQRKRFLDERFKEIEYFKKFTFQDYQSDVHKRRDIEKWVQDIINVNIDIAKIILASEKRDMPKSYEYALRDFAILVGFDLKKAEKFSKFANLRNILAHEYLDILYKRIQNFIKESSLFYKKILSFLEKYLK